MRGDSVVGGLTSQLCGMAQIVRALRHRLRRANTRRPDRPPRKASRRKASLTGLTGLTATAWPREGRLMPICDALLLNASRTTPARGSPDNAILNPPEADPPADKSAL